MTDAPAAFQANFADFRIIRTRKVASIVLEIPIEAADAALHALGGLPNPAAERWVAVARLNPPGEAPPPEPEPETDPETRRPFASLPCATQAGIRCAEAPFRDYLVHRSLTWGIPMSGVIDADTAAAYVRGVCGVSSRRELDLIPEARERWTRLQDAYWLWKRGYEDR